MTYGILPFKYEVENNPSGLTALAGLPVYLDFAKVMGLSESIEKHLKIRENTQGWTDKQIVNTIVLLNIAGGSKVSDLKILEADAGFCEILRKAEMHGLPRKERRALEKRWRKEKKRSVPSPSSVFRYLAEFHDTEQEKDRKISQKAAFIPAPNNHLLNLQKVNQDIISSMQFQSPQPVVTIDMDATLVETNKRDAMYSYKGFKAYQPLNVYWAEQEVILHSEFRDGNVPAGYEQLRVFKEALNNLPPGVKKVRLRSDTAGYQHDLMEFCDTCKVKPFGKIEFAIGAKVSNSFKKAVLEVEDSDWSPLYKTVNGRKVKTDSQWAEVCFVPNEIAHSKKGQEYRFLAKRQVLEQQLSIPGMDEDKNSDYLPFPTMDMSSKKYKVFGIVTNINEQEMCGGDIINWLHKRCGKSEMIHSEMKNDMAGGVLPSGDFGVNAAWWAMMIIALNLNTMMKKLTFDKKLSKSRMKEIRFSIINIPGKIIKRSRSLIIKLSCNHPSFDLLLKARERIANLKIAPG